MGRRGRKTKTISLLVAGRWYRVREEATGFVRKLRICSMCAANKPTALGEVTTLLF